MIADLLNTPDVPELGPGTRQGVASEATLAERLKPLLAEAGIASTRADLIRATVLLWHDHLEPAHRIVQDIDTADGSYIHAVMHRREPDYTNAKYWFRRVGEHPCFSRLTALPGTRDFVRGGAWDPYAFVDACERNPQSAALRELQAQELRILLQYLLAAR